MLRTTFATLLVLTLCLAPTTARAGEDDAPKKIVQIHNATDLVERVPGLTEALRTLVPDATLHEHQPGIYVLKATGAVHDDFHRILEGIRRDVAQETMEADAVLDRARANARTLAQLRTSEVTLDAEELSVQTLLTMVAQSIELNTIVSQEANGKMAEATASVRFHAAPGKECLDAIAKLGDVRWVLDGGIVRIVTPEVLVPGRIEVEFTTESFETGSEEERAGRGEEEDLEDMVRALREEVRALRAEVREVKRILEELRAR